MKQVLIHDGAVVFARHEERRSVERAHERSAAQAHQLEEEAEFNAWWSAHCAASEFDEDADDGFFRTIARDAFHAGRSS